MIGSKQQLPERHKPTDFNKERDREEQLTTADMAAAGQSNQTERPDFAQRPDVIDAEFVGATASREEDDALLDQKEAEDFRHRWEKIQTGFVDEPRKAVEQADKLVAATMSHLAEVFAAERENLEREWAKGEDVSTEDLRIALRRYRSFFDRLLTV